MSNGVKEEEAMPKTLPQNLDTDGLCCGTSNSHNSLKAVLILGINS